MKLYLSLKSISELAELPSEERWCVFQKALFKVPFRKRFLIAVIAMCPIILLQFSFVDYNLLDYYERGFALLIFAFLYSQLCFSMKSPSIRKILKDHNE